MPYKTIIKANHSIKSLIFLDFETTGLHPSKGDRIIEIGAVVVEENRITDEFESLVKIGFSIPESVSRINGITDGMLLNQPCIEDVLPGFMAFIGEDTLAAHNMKFDMAFLRRESGKLGFSIKNKTFCTLKMSRRLFPFLSNHRLETVARHVLGTIPDGSKRHRALGDARLAALIWMAIEKRRIN